MARSPHRLRWRYLILIGFMVGGCTPSPEQQAAAFQPSEATLAARMRQSRRFDTSDRAFMLQSAVATLQDLGFTIEETSAEHGIIVGSKLAGGKVRAQVSLVTNAPATIVRVVFQHIVLRPGAMLAVGETLSDPVLYQGFFDKLAQSAFLTAHDI